MSVKGNYMIRTMSRDEVSSIAIELAVAEGWNPGWHDAEAFYVVDPDGFLVGTLDGEPIACISAVRYDDTFGFIGLYIVKKEYRGKGYGLKIWEAAMAYLTNHNIGLDGVVNQQSNYKKSGFQLAYNNIRYQGISAKYSDRSSAITSALHISLEDLVEYDAAIFSIPRPIFLHKWIHMNQAASFVYRSEGKIRGYAVVRKCRVGYKIGPLFGDDFSIAERLFKACSDYTEAGSPIFLDIPEPNKSALLLVKKFQMQPFFETARMYTQQAPEIDLRRLYGVTSFELG